MNTWEPFDRAQSLERTRLLRYASVPRVYPFPGERHSASQPPGRINPADEAEIANQRSVEMVNALREERIKGFTAGVVFAVVVPLLGYAAAIGAGALLIHFGMTPP